jgi:predicted enzyme related to lactoylglutathione lyase
MANPFVHVELNTTDVDKAKAFYTKLFDWELKDMPMPSGMYTTIGVGAGTGGGLTKQMMPGAPSAWLPYVEVADIHEATKKAKSLGANVLLDSEAVPDMGWLSIFIDPTGATLGLWQTKMA